MLTKNSPAILATLCYIQKSGKTLMLHRVKKPDDIHAGKWNGLGGKMLPGEMPEECVIREVKEESGLILAKPVLRGILTFPRFARGKDWYVYLFTASRYKGTLSPSKEGILHWIENDKIHDLPLWEGDHLFLEWIKQGKFFSAKFIYRNGKLKNYKVIYYQKRKSPSGLFPGGFPEVAAL